MDVESTDSESKFTYQSRKLTIQDVNAIAKQVGELQLTETEACHRLNIKPVRWFTFKQRAKVQSKFDTVLARIKADAIAACLNRIDKSANGVEVKQPDWRAAAWRAERLDSRFVLQDKSQAVTQPTVNVLVMSEAAKRIYDVETEKPMKLLESPAVCIPQRGK